MHFDAFHSLSASWPSLAASPRAACWPQSVLHASSLSPLCSRSCVSPSKTPAHVPLCLRLRTPRSCPYTACRKACPRGRSCSLGPPRASTPRLLCPIGSRHAWKPHLLWPTGPPRASTTRLLCPMEPSHAWTSLRAGRTELRCPKAQRRAPTLFLPSPMGARREPSSVSPQTISRHPSRCPSVCHPPLGTAPGAVGQSVGHRGEMATRRRTPAGRCARVAVCPRLEGREDGTGRRPACRSRGRRGGGR